MEREEKYYADAYIDSRASAQSGARLYPDDGSGVIIYRWDKKNAPLSSDESIALCARGFAETRGLDRVASLLADREKSLIGRDARGKPFFEAIPEIRFSLSHSGDLAACAVYNEPVGLDIQHHVVCDKEAIAKRFFHQDEYAYLKKRGFEPFFDVWTAKESYVKRSGVGIFGGFKRFCVVDDDGVKSQVNGLSLIRVDAGEKYSMCLCVAERSRSGASFSERSRAGVSRARSGNIAIYQLVNLQYNE